jgi:hypothetical protein
MATSHRRRLYRTALATNLVCKRINQTSKTFTVSSREQSEQPPRRAVGELVRSCSVRPEPARLAAAAPGSAQRRRLEIVSRHVWIRTVAAVRFGVAAKRSAGAGGAAAI